MALITWSTSLSVGVQEIDQQHQKLIVLINNLNDAMKAGKSKEVLQEIITELINYTWTHFLAEEKMMERCGYPDTAAHKKKHLDFVNNVYDFRDKFATGKLGLSIDVMTFLSNWLREHIQGTDQQYSAFFKEQGIR